MLKILILLKLIINIKFIFKLFTIYKSKIKKRKIRFNDIRRHPIIK